MIINLLFSIRWAGISKARQGDVSTTTKRSGPVVASAFWRGPFPLVVFLSLCLEMGQKRRDVFFACREMKSNGISSASLGGTSLAVLFYDAGTRTNSTRSIYVTFYSTIN